MPHADSDGLCWYEGIIVTISIVPGTHCWKGNVFYRYIVTVKSDFKICFVMNHIYE